MDPGRPWIDTELASWEAPVADFHAAKMLGDVALGASKKRGTAAHGAPCVSSICSRMSYTT